MDIDTLKKGQELVSAINEATNFCSNLMLATSQNRIAEIKVQSDVYKSGSMYMDTETAEKVVGAIKDQVKIWQAEFDAL